MNNRPVPVKLLPAGSNRTQLMKVIGEKNVKFNQNDYIEKRAGEMVTPILTQTITTFAKIKPK